MSAEKDFKSRFSNIQPSLESLARYKQMFMEKNTGKLLSKEATTDLFGHAEDLDMAANVTLQAELLVSAM